MGKHLQQRNLNGWPFSVGSPTLLWHVRWSSAKTKQGTGRTYWLRLIQPVLHRVEPHFDPRCQHQLLPHQRDYV